MKREAAEAGFYSSEAMRRQVPRLQILTIVDLLSGRELQYPRMLEVTHKQAPRAKSARATNMSLPLGKE